MKRNLYHLSKNVSETETSFNGISTLKILFTQF